MMHQHVRRVTRRSGIALARTVRPEPLAMRSPILPGSTLGIVGGGAAGRAIALAAQDLGYRVRALDADPSCLVEPLTERSIRGPVDHAGAAVEAVGSCDVVTPSFEQVPSRTLAAIERAGALIRPAPALLALAQNRMREREWLAARGMPLVPWHAATTLDEALAALADLGGTGVLKPALRQQGQTVVRRVGTPTELTVAWDELGGVCCTLEQFASIDAELSVIVARSATGAVAVHPVAESRRTDRDGTPRLLWSVIPPICPVPHAEKARRLATSIAERLGVEGLLAVELFLLTDGRLVVNELVPCPHPTFAAAERACATGQYEQLVRAICGLPLGPTEVVRPMAIAPVHGDEWQDGDLRAVEVALRVRGVTLRAYGVSAPSATQRVGHLAASGETPDQAVTRVLQARTVLRARRSDPRAEHAATDGADHGASESLAALLRRAVRAMPHAGA